MLPDGWWPLLVVPLVAIAALLSRAVTRGGAVAGTAVAAVLASGLGWSGLAMLTLLLVIGTLVSARGSRRRDTLQVLCNGAVAVAGGLLAAVGVEFGWWIAAGALATALGDTLSSELGRRCGNPRALLLGRTLERGADGGMTIGGTLFGLLGAALVAAAASWPPLLPLVAAGFAGTVVDSVVGLYLQPHLGARGNDWTNLIATAVGGGLAAWWV